VDEIERLLGFALPHFVAVDPFLDVGRVKIERVRRLQVALALLGGQRLDRCNRLALL